MQKIQPQCDTDSRLAEVEAFTRSFRHTSRGNLTRREYDGIRLTVFRYHGRYGWAIHNDETDDVSYSRENYDTQADALSALAQELEVGRLYFCFDTHLFSRSTIMSDSPVREIAEEYETDWHQWGGPRMTYCEANLSYVNSPCDMCGRSFGEPSWEDCDDEDDFDDDDIRPSEDNRIPAGMEYIRVEGGVLSRSRYRTTIICLNCVATMKCLVKKAEEVKRRELEKYAELGKEAAAKATSVESAAV